jgi:VCBS repeat-containing protein
VASSEPTSTGGSVVPGEVLRLRMVVQLPEGTAPSAEIAPTLPAGLRFVNDGSTTLAFVANDGGIDSTTIVGASFDASGGGADAAAIVAIVPTRVMPGAAIVDGLGAPIASGAVMAAGAAPRFVLGDLSNADRDADKEFVVIEFNAIVDNATGLTSGAANPVVFDWRTDGASRGQSNVVDTTLGEPSIVDLDKRVVSLTGGRVTFEAVFTNTGTEDAHDVRLTDSFAGATNIAFDGAGSVTGLPVGASNASVGDALVVTIPMLAPGDSVSIRYVATVTDLTQPVPPRDAEVVYTSLSASGVSLTTATSAGSVVTATTGERTGSPLDYGAAVNTYRDTDPAGLNKLTGTLWDDTEVPDGAIGGTEARLEGLTVRLDHAGADGSFGTGDDLSLTAVTDSNGYYGFGALPGGDIRITAPTIVANGNGTLGELLPRIDVQGAPTDSTIALTIGSGILYQNQNFGYVQTNDAPTVTAPAGPLSVDEDTPLPIAGITVGDPDARATNTNSVTLTVGAGTLALTPGAGIATTGNGSATLTLTGTIADLNAALATLVYQGARDATGPDRLDLRIDDRGNTGDADGDRLPGEPGDDNLFAVASVDIVVLPLNDAPVARPDARTLTEDQTVSDGAAIAGSPAGDLADSDVDGDPLSVVGVVAGSVGGPLAGGVGVPLVSALGTLTLFQDGRYTYDPAVDLQAGVSVQDVFSYSVSDGLGGVATTTITITITGANDPPQAFPDANRVAADSTAGVSGNVVAGGAATDRPDVDPDAGDVLTVQGVAAGTTSGALSGAVGTPVAGAHGSLVVGPDGAYTYRVDPADTAVLALRPGESLTDTFSYTVVDRSGATSTTTLTITIDGADDPPRASPDVNRVSAQSPVAAVGNVIGGGGAGDAPDIDPDGDPLSVQGVRTGADPSTPAASGVGATVPGRFGSLVLNADGSYAYTVDPANPEVRALRPGESLSEVYTYTVRDPSGQVATTTLTIVIDGVNDAPVAGSVRQTLDQSQSPGAPPAVEPPTVTDVDDSATALTVRIDAIGRPEAGAFLRPDGRPIAPGDTLTVAELQGLRYQPAPVYAATPSGDGTLPGGTLAFTVTDPSGASAQGSIEIALRPTVAAAPPEAPTANSSVPALLPTATGLPPGTSPAADAPLSSFFDSSPLGRPLSAAPPATLAALGAAPVSDMLRAVAGTSAFGAGLVQSEGAMLRPYTMGALAAPPGLDDVPGDYVRQAVLEARDAMAADRLRLDAKSGRLDLDADGLFPSNRIDGLFGDERIGPTRAWNPLLTSGAVVAEPVVEAAAAVAPAAAVLSAADDCEPAPKPKPKPIKRILPAPLVRPAPSFSEQLDVQKKKFRPPAKVAPKLPPARQC